MPALPSHLPVPVREFAVPLLAWYDRNRRTAPWRDHPDWYRVWISEIMLQQTRVKTVLPYFEVFLNAFPNVETLAEAGEEDVLALWAGLGYYSRARNLLKTARLICSKHGARFPTDFDTALALPGVGRYTAGAVLSIAFGRPFPAIDGNVIRIFTRYLACTDSWGATSARQLWGLLSSMVNDGAVRNRVGDFNQALMELGATICPPRKPVCPECPLAASCVGRRLSLQNSIPPKRRARPLVAADYTVALVRKQEALLMCPTRSGPFPRGMWELPGVSGVPGDDFAERLEKETGLRVQTGEIRGAIVHDITHHRITLHVVEAFLVDETLPEVFDWIDFCRPKVGISAYVKKALKLKPG